MLKRCAVLGLGLLVLAAFSVGCQAIEPMPEFENNYEKGSWLQETGRYDQAIQAFEDFRAERPDSVLIPMLLLRQGECYEALGNNEKAIHAYEKAIAESPDEVGPFAKENLEALQQRIEAERAAEAEAARLQAEEEAARVKAEEEARRAAEAEKAAEELDERQDEED